MAKVQQKKDRIVERPAFKGFVNFSLTDEQKAAIKAIRLSVDALDESLTLLFEEGYKVYWSFDFKNEVYQCALTNNDISHENAGKFLSGRGSTPMKALKQVLWVHHNLFPHKIWPTDIPNKVDLDD